jgi:hypothetical protein
MECHVVIWGKFNIRKKQFRAFDVLVDVVAVLAYAVSRHFPFESKIYQRNQMRKVVEERLGIGVIIIPNDRQDERKLDCKEIPPFIRLKTAKGSLPKYRNYSFDPCRCADSLEG